MHSQGNDITVFSELKETAHRIAEGVIDTSLGKRVYNSKEVQNWVNSISDNVIKSLTDYNKNFKFMVTCIIMQKNDAGLNVASTCYWNSQVDGYCTIKWENNTMFCIVNVFGVGL
jgi:dynein light chain Tctex-type 1